jgi:hypothetical protein
VAFALTGLISPPPPIAGAPAADVVPYYANHHTGLELESVEDGIGATLLVLFASTFHSRIRTMPSLTVFVAAAIVAGLRAGAGGGFPRAGLPPKPATGGGGTSQHLRSFTFQVATFPTLLFLGAAVAAWSSPNNRRRLATVHRPPDFDAADDPAGLTWSQFERSWRSSIAERERR